MIATIGINAVIGFLVPNVAWQAHLGGLVAGALLAAVIALSRSRRQPGLAWVGIVAVLAVVVVLGVARYALSPTGFEAPFG